MKQKMIASSIMAFLCLSIFLSNVWAGNFEIGIRAGDWVKYSYTEIGILPYGQASNITWIKIEFTSVINTATEEKVRFLMTSSFQNGTETNQTVTLDLRSEPAGYHGILIPLNSRVGETFNVGGSSTTIQNETTKTYAGASRTVFSAVTPQTNSTICWDKQTGIMVEAYSVYITYSTKLAMIETNMWIPQFLGLDWWLWIIIIVIIVGIAILAALMLRKRKPALTGPSGQQAQPPPPNLRRHRNRIFCSKIKSSIDQSARASRQCSNE